MRVGRHSRLVGIVKNKKTKDYSLVLIMCKLVLTTFYNSGDIYWINSYGGVRALKKITDHRLFLYFFVYT